jgi:hypothetical protein
MGYIEQARACIQKIKLDQPEQLLDMIDGLVTLAAQGKYPLDSWQRGTLDIALQHLAVGMSKVAKAYFLLSTEPPSVRLDHPIGADKERLEKLTPKFLNAAISHLQEHGSLPAGY